MLEYTRIYLNISLSGRRGGLSSEAGGRAGGPGECTNNPDRKLENQEDQ
jgi:hypothetical protein